MSKTHKKHNHKHHHHHGSKEERGHRHRSKQEKDTHHSRSSNKHPSKEDKDDPSAHQPKQEKHAHHSRSSNKHPSKEDKEDDSSAQQPKHTKMATDLLEAATSSVSSTRECGTAAASCPEPDLRSASNSSTSDDVSVSLVANGVDVPPVSNKEEGTMSLFEVVTTIAGNTVTEGEPKTVFQPHLVTAPPYKEADIAELPAEDMAIQLMIGQGVNGASQIELTSPACSNGVKDICKDGMSTEVQTTPDILKSESESHCVREDGGLGKRSSRRSRSTDSGQRSRSPPGLRRSTSRSYTVHKDASLDSQGKLKTSYDRSNESQRHSSHRRSHSQPRRAERSPSRSRKSPCRSRRARSRSQRACSRSQRSRSRSHRSRSRSRRAHSRSQRSRSRSHSRSHRSRSRSRRAHSRSHRSRSRSQSRSRRAHSRSHRSRARLRRAHSRSQTSQSRSQRARSRSHPSCSTSERRTISGSRNSGTHSRAEYELHHSGHTSSQQCPEDKMTTTGLGTTITTAPPTTTSVPPLPTDPKQHTISVLVTMCKDLAEKQALEDKTGVKDESQLKEYIGNIRAPFALAPTLTTGHVFQSATRKTPNQIALEAPVPAKPLEQLYPVSAGLQHGGDTGVAAQPVAVGELVAKRLEAAVRLQANPMDTVAMQTLAEVEAKTSQWCKSLVKPGQFTGATVVRPMSMKDHNTGYQAWAKKSMFKDLAPVAAGFGLKMLKKMGWEEGCPLGRSGRGIVEPIVVEVKMDRLGLGTGDMFTAKSLLGKGGGSKAITHYQGLGTGKGGGSKATTHYQGLGTGDTFTPKVPKVNNRHASKAAKRLQGKHPVCVLQEVCVKKHWGVPNYQLVHCAGSARIIQVSIGAVGTFKPALPSRNMKQAKVEAALAALHGMGIMGPEGQWIL